MTPENIDPAKESKVNAVNIFLDLDITRISLFPLFSSFINTFTIEDFPLLLIPNRESSGNLFQT